MVCLSAVHRIQFLTYISSLCFTRHCSLMEPFFDKNWKTKEQKQTPCIWQEQWPHQNATSHFYHLHKFNAQQKVKMLAQLLEGNIMLKQQVLNNLLTYKETCTDLVMGFLTIGESILAFPFFFGSPPNWLAQLASIRLSSAQTVVFPYKSGCPI